jgi:hypothetical protein
MGLAQQGTDPFDRQHQDYAAGHCKNDQRGNREVAAAEQLAIGLSSGPLGYADFYIRKRSQNQSNPLAKALTVDPQVVESGQVVVRVEGTLFPFPKHDKSL